MKFYILLMFLFSMSAFAQTDSRSVNRYWLMNDRFDTDDIMRPYERDIVRINIDGAASADFPDFVSDVGDALDADDDAALIALATEYMNTEQFLKADVGVGVWLPGWNMFNTDVLPSLRLEVSAGNLTTVSETGSAVDLCALYNIPAEYCGGTAALGIGDDYMEMYVQATARAGLNLDFKYDQKWTLDTFFYGMLRYDALQLLNATDAAGGSVEIEMQPELTETLTGNADISLGFNDGTTRIFAGVSELRLTTIKDKSDNDAVGARDLFMGNSPVYRLHAERTFHDVFLFDVIPFAGVHKREQYDLSDGYYGGAKFIFGWKNLHFAAAGMYDPQYITLTPRLQVWILDIEGNIKIPHEDKDEFGVELARIYGVNLRVHF
ncbi:MAG: hypothetical protein JNM93_04970 [Bacteriovoracaceae bacterium]|nr:hypothetical protein [Bacteriovoracaceae bacterium]